MNGAKLLHWRRTCCKTISWIKFEIEPAVTEFTNDVKYLNSECLLHAPSKNHKLTGQVGKYYILITIVQDVATK